jgi:hypothetical protein
MQQGGHVDGSGIVELVVEYLNRTTRRLGDHRQTGRTQIFFDRLSMNRKEVLKISLDVNGTRTRQLRFQGGLDQALDLSNIESY